MFSPNGAVRARIIEKINKAQSSSDVAIYNFTTDELRDALVAARSRGMVIGARDSDKWNQIRAKLRNDGPLLLQPD